MASMLLVLSVPAQAEVVDRIVSVVAQGVVTQSDVRLEEAIHARDVSPIPPFQGGDALTRLEDYRVIVRLAGNVKLFQPEALDLEERLRDFAATFELRADYAAFLRRWGLDGHALREQLKVRMVCERYIQRNVGLALPGDPSEDAWSEAYEAFMAPHRLEASVRRVTAW